MTVKYLPLLTPTDIIRDELGKLMKPIVDDIAKQLPVMHTANKHMGIYEQFIQNLTPTVPLVHVVLQLSFQQVENQLWKAWKKNPEYFESEPARYTTQDNGDAHLVINGLPSGELVVNLNASLKANASGGVMINRSVVDFGNAYGALHLSNMRALLTTITVAGIMATVVKEWVIPA